MQSLTLTVSPVCAVMLFPTVPRYDMHSSLYAVMMNLPHLGAMRASAPSLVNPPKQCAMMAMLNHNWILLLPSSCTSVPRWLMKFEWVLQQKWNIIRTWMMCTKLALQCPGGWALHPQTCTPVENEQHNSLSLRMHHCFCALPFLLILAANYQLHSQW